MAKQKPPRPLPKKLQHLLRTVGRRHERPIVLVVCEGATTEPNYFAGLVDFYRLGNVTVRPALGSAPMTIVKDAITAKREREEKAKKSTTLLAFDAVWCVFDVDQHPHVRQALKLADENGVQVGLSNPCFEFWLVLHFERFATTNTTRHQMQKRLARYLKGYQKGQNYCKQLLPHVSEAVDRAEEILRSQWGWKAVTPAQVNQSNPSTSVHTLVRKLSPPES